MPRLDVRRTYADGYNLLKQDLDAFVDDIETFVNLTRLNDDNFQDASITASTKSAAASITTAKLANSNVTTAKILDGAVTSAKILDEVVTTSHITADNVTSAKIATNAVTTSKIATGAVTTAKIEDGAVGVSEHAIRAVASSSTSGALSVIVDTVICSVQIVSNGRPIFVGLTSDGSGNASFVGMDQRATALNSSSEGLQIYAAVELKRTTASVDTVLNYASIMRYSAPSYMQLNSVPMYSPANIGTIYVPPGYFWFIDSPAAGTHTYTFTLKPGYTGVGSPYTSVTYNASILYAKAYYCKAIAYEL